MYHINHHPAALWRRPESRAASRTSRTPSKGKEVKAGLIEAFLVMEVTIFWLVALPIAAAIWFIVSVSDRIKPSKDRVLRAPISPAMRRGTRGSSVWLVHPEESAKSK